MGLLSWMGLWGQGFVRSHLPKVISGSEELNLFWEGGLNAPHFSEMDIDFDGKSELVAFDRSSNQFHIYKTGALGQVMPYLPKLERWPKVQNWAYLRDFNCDGKADLICSGPQNGVLLHLNRSMEPGVVDFGDPIPLLANFSYSSGSYSAPMYVANIDLPAIDDVDGDGDLDLLVFGFGLNTIEYYKNTSIEEGAGCGWGFTLVNSCFAYLEEGFSNNEILTGVKTCSNQVTNAEKNLKHAGSTVAFYRSDHPSDRSLLIGDISFGSITRVRLAPSATLGDSATFSENNFPTVQPVNVALFPSISFVDWGMPRSGHFISAPNTSFSIDNFQGVWFYPNGSTELLDPSEPIQGFIQNQAGDFGENTVLASTDFDGDGRADLIMGGRGKSNGSGYTPALRLLLNRGDGQNPRYEVANENLGNLGSLGFGGGAYPAAGDLDGDGLVDVIVGNAVGRLFRMEKQGNDLILVGNALTNPSGQVIDVGDFASPALADIDGDGKLDLIIGERNGNLNYYRNTGTLSNPQFTLISEQFGQVNTQAFAGDLGYSTPAFEREGSSLYLWVGARDGRIRKFLVDNTGGAFEEVESGMSNLFCGERVAPTPLDVNNDGAMDLMVGCFGGSAAFFMGLIPNSIDKNQHEALWIHPNPTASGKVHLQGADVLSRVRLLSLDGRLLREVALDTNGWIDLDGLPSGMYQLGAKVKGQWIYRKLIVEAP